MTSRGSLLRTLGVTLLAGVIACGGGGGTADDTVADDVVGDGPVTFPSPLYGDSSDDPHRIAGDDVVAVALEFMAPHVEEGVDELVECPEDADGSEACVQLFQEREDEAAFQVRLGPSDDPRNFYAVIRLVHDEAAGGWAHTDTWFAGDDIPDWIDQTEALTGS